jgi:hypothetical protein
MDIKRNIQTLKDMANSIKNNKLQNKSNYDNYKILIYELIDTISNLYPHVNSKKFVSKIIKENKNKMDKNHKKMNIREFLYYLYVYDIISSYSEENIRLYSNDNAYHHIFLLDVKTRFITLIFLYFGLIKDSQNNYSLNLNAAINELILLL